eukprot:TRINITY_DN11429_c0_g1_i2.p1 TRINITY_DN11429_c0_g1~~TRINITY_DN11429_c0_g1_i2.p1  ORF type:complete len:337 (+),score=65.05 TRINITY_DN11429_c0_g1_i2:111-1121(+)
MSRVKSMMTGLSAQSSSRATMLPRRLQKTPDTRDPSAGMPRSSERNIISSQGGVNVPKGRAGSSEMSPVAEKLNDFIAVRCATDPSMSGLITFDRDEAARVQRSLNKKRIYDESIATNAASTIIEQWDTLSNLELSVQISLMGRSGHYGRYQGRGNSERRAIEMMCSNMDRVLALPMKGLASTVSILCVSGLRRDAQVTAIIDETVDRIAGWKLRDFESVVFLLRTLADEDFYAPQFFSVCMYHIMLNIEFVPRRSLISLVSAYRAASHEATELFEVIQERSLADADNEDQDAYRARLDFAMHTTQRHRGSTPMISRGAQQEWLNIPGFDQRRDTQ